jgi:guanylate kinase
MRLSDINSPKQYLYVKSDFFQGMVATNYLLEHEKVHEDFYGTLLMSLEIAKHLGKDLLLEIDIKGVLQMIKRKEAGEEIFKGVEIFPVFLYRRFSPLESISYKSFEEFIRSALKKRDEGISEKTLSSRVNSAFEEYDLVFQNRDKLNLLENFENNMLLTLDYFDKLHKK